MPSQIFETWLRLKIRGLLSGGYFSILRSQQYRHYIAQSNTLSGPPEIDPVIWKKKINPSCSAVRKYKIPVLKIAMMNNT